jgi:hypothetical protein
MYSLVTLTSYKLHRSFMAARPHTLAPEWAYVYEKLLNTLVGTLFFLTCWVIWSLEISQKGRGVRKREPSNLKAEERMSSDKNLGLKKPPLDPLLPKMKVRDQGKCRGSRGGFSYIWTMYLEIPLWLFRYVSF